MTLCWCLLLTLKSSTPHPIVSIVDCEQVNVNGVVLVSIARRIGQSLLPQFPFIEKYR